MFAFENADQETYLFRNSCNNRTLAIALKELFNANNEIKIIGERHGEKYI
jgi:UDP-glucose 4-epimerase